MAPGGVGAQVDARGARRRPLVGIERLPALGLVLREERLRFGGGWPHVDLLVELLGVGEAAGRRSDELRLAPGGDAVPVVERGRTQLRVEAEVLGAPVRVADDLGADRPA